MTIAQGARGDSLIRFAKEKPAPAPTLETSTPPWKVLIVDDDDQVHLVTRMVLADLVVDNRRPRFISAFSGAEARHLLGQHNDIAVIFLDVVMESDHAGLMLARHVREELSNERVRIILRTGQPGQAPERHVIDHYDINDYRAKADLTAEKLYTAAATALRSYRDIEAIDDRRRGFERIIAASAGLYRKKTVAAFVEALFPALHSVIPGMTGLLVCADTAEGVRVVAAGGEVAARAGDPLAVGLPPGRCREIEGVFADQTSVFHDGYCVILLRSRTGAHRAAYLTGYRGAQSVDRSLLELFCDKAATAFDNAYLNEQVLAAQHATVYALGKLADYKDEVDSGHPALGIGTLASRTARRLKETGHHVDLIDDDWFEKIELASILHDVGKVAIPDAILQKPGPLAPEERVIIQRHVAVGTSLLREAAAMVDRPTYLSMSVDVARHHHERFDGKGYPQGLAGHAIPLSAQIVAIADVYDALRRARHYKKAWPRDQAMAFIREESGNHFAPEIVEAFLAVVTEVDSLSAA